MFSVVAVASAAVLAMPLLLASGSLVLGQGLGTSLLNNPIAYVSDPALLPTSEEVRDMLEYMGSGSIFVSSCFYGSDATTNHKGLYISAIQRLIWHSEIRRQELEAAGYPTEVVDRALRPARDAYLLELRSEYKAGLEYPRTEILPDHIYARDIEAVRILNAYKKTSATNLPDIDKPHGPECGGDYYGENYITVEPENGLVYLITENNFLWCAARGMDAYTNADCDLWQQIPSGVSIPNGVYRYEARWPDGTVETGGRRSVIIENEVTLKLRMPRS